MASRRASGEALMLATWAPADMFTGPVSMITMPLRRSVTYFSEHTLVLALVFVVVAAVIALVEAVNG